MFQVVKDSNILVVCSPSCCILFQLSKQLIKLSWKQLIVLKACPPTLDQTILQCPSLSHLCDESLQCWVGKQMFSKEFSSMARTGQTFAVLFPMKLFHTKIWQDKLCTCSRPFRKKQISQTGQGSTNHTQNQNLRGSTTTPWLPATHKNDECGVGYGYLRKLSGLISNRKLTMRTIMSLCRLYISPSKGRKRGSWCHRCVLKRTSIPWPQFARCSTEFLPLSKMKVLSKTFKNETQKSQNVRNSISFHMFLVSVPH